MTYAVDDEFGNQITTGLSSYESAVHRAHSYLAAHDDAPGVTIYEDCDGGESWELSRRNVLDEQGLGLCR